MAFDYDALYQSTPNALGAPTKEFVTFFASLQSEPLAVLDLGCGQGRDAIFIAELGHAVTGVDISEAGVRQLNQTAKDRSLNIEAICADLTQFTTDERFDILLIDRTLHMLNKTQQSQTLQNALSFTKNQSWVLIADEKQNLPAFRNIFAKHPRTWQTLKDEKGYLFMKSP